MFKKVIALLLSVYIVANVNAQDWVSKMADPSVNFYEVQSSFNKYWKKEEKKEKFRKFIGINKELEEKNEGFYIYKRWENFVEQRVSPSGDRQLLTEAEKELQKYITDPTHKSAMQAGGAWQPIGSTLVPTNGGGAGRINCVRFDPNNSNSILIGTPAGGIWRSYDGGVSWSTNSDNLPSMGVNDIAVDPSNSNVIYIATGDDDGGDTYSVGVLKSTDGGLTWQMTGLSYLTTQARKISRVLVNPINPNIVFAGTSAGIFRSTNAGLTWTKVHNANPVKDMEFKPGDPTVVYAVSSKSFYRSTNSGATFSVVASSNGTPSALNVGRLAIAVTPANPSYVYLVATDATENGFYGLYRSNDNGQTFSLRANNPNLMGWDVDGSDTGGQGWYTLSIAASPFDSEEVAIGGVNIWRSYDGGMSWQIIAHWYGAGGTPYVHADIHDLIYKPSNGDIYTGCDGGIFYSSDGGSSFNDLSNGLQIGQMYRMGGAATNASITIQGWQDNGTNLQSGLSWSRPMGGDGMECFIDWSNSNYMYGELYYGDISRSNDGGASFNGIKNNISEDGEWVTPWLQDPVNPQTLYAGYKNVWKSTNRGDTWTQISTFNSGGLSSLAVAPSNTQTIYASNGGIIYKTINGGGAWTTINPAGAGTDDITYIAVSNIDANTIWITRSGYSNGNKVFKSIDGGATWTNISYDLPNVPANCIVSQNGTNGGVYVGTDIGVFYTDNTMNSWMPFNNGLPFTIINELEIHYGSNKLRAATYGRGLWQTSIYNPSSSLPFANFAADTLAGCPGLTVQFYDSTLNNPTSWQWYFEGGTPSTSILQNPTVIYNNPGAYYDVKLIATNAFGVDSVIKLNYIAVSPGTRPEITLNNNDTLCAGQTVQLASSFGNSYSWYPTNQTSATLNINSTNQFAVTIKDVFGCSLTSDTIGIYVFAVPPVPVITMSNDTLYSSSSTGNQWYLNGTAISGATDSIYVVTSVGGTYSVVVFDSSGVCSSTSSPFVGINEISSIGISYSLYPNPSHDLVNMIMYQKGNDDLTVQLLDISGKILYEKYYSGAYKIEEKIDLTSYSKGIYLLNIKNSKGAIHKKIIRN